MEIFAPLSDDGFRRLAASEFAITEAGLSPETVLEALSVHGALLIRGLSVADADDFDAFVSLLGLPRLNYIYRSTPRTSVANGIFTATEYPPEETIPLHNENAYQLRWPLAVAFCCITPAEVGGETPIADMRRVTAAIPAELMSKFATLGVRYTRVYRETLDLPWSVVFQTKDPKEVEAFCRESNLLWRWDGDILTTTQVCQGTATHPRTGEEFLFNQAHLFHPSGLDPDVAELLLETLGEAGLPRNAHFGDGTPITDAELAAVRAAFTENEVAFSWQAGDVLLLDNMRVAHGRRPFKGRRRVLAALLQGHSSDQTAGIRREPPSA
jgi:alpha-ketoglutarate-dependent taurine dioxygenase